MTARSATQLYEDDFFAWTQLQAKELWRFARTRSNLPLDRARRAGRALRPSRDLELTDLGKQGCSDKILP